MYQTAYSIYDYLFIFKQLENGCTRPVPMTPGVTVSMIPTQCVSATCVYVSLASTIPLAETPVLVVSITDSTSVLK